MGYKSTIRLNRVRALDVLHGELETLPNGMLERILDIIADSGLSRSMSTLDNFSVSDFNPED